MILTLDAYLCSSESCAAFALDLVRTCNHHGVVVRVWPGEWLRPVGAEVPPELADVVLEHSARLAQAGWDGSFPALLLPDGRAGGGEIWPAICRELGQSADSADSADSRPAQSPDARGGA